MPVTFDHGEFCLSDPDFHMPKATGNVIVDAGARLLDELRRVGWDVPGLDVRVRTYGEDADLVRVVEEVSGETADGPFRLRFGLPQGTVGKWNVTTGLGDVCVPPGIKAHFYSDNSGPSAELYRGKDWKADGARFARESHLHAKMDGKPKTYLLYSRERGHGDVLSPVRDPREHAPSLRDPSRLTITGISAAVRDTVDAVVARLAALPDAPGHDDPSPKGDSNLRRLARVEPIPVPDDMPVLFSWAEENDVYRGARGRDEDRFLVKGNGARLASLGVRGPVPAKAYDGFSYASADPSVRAGQVIHGPREHSLPAVIRLKDLNEIYVVDNAAFDRAQDAAFAKASAEGRDGITDAELNESVAATARTMVPYAEYAGGYGKPVVVIGRRLGLDECRPAMGPVSLSAGEDGVRATLTDAETGTAFTLFEEDRDVTWTRRYAERAAERAVDALGTWTQRPPRIDRSGFDPAPEAEALPAPRP